jgi:hypothetical protein
MTAAALLAALAYGPATARVTVQFVEPQHYIDAGGYGVDQERNLRTLERHFTALGERCLPQDQNLELRILDVDLAGREEWWHRGAYDLRVMRDITWPRLELEYVRRDASGAVLDEGRERVADMSYLWRSSWVRYDSDPLPYEKAMLRDWFGQRFCPDRY